MDVNQNARLGLRRLRRVHQMCQYSEFQKTKFLEQKDQENTLI